VSGKFQSEPNRDVGLFADERELRQNLFDQFVDKNDQLFHVGRLATVQRIVGLDCETKTNAHTEGAEKDKKKEKTPRRLKIADAVKNETKYATRFQPRNISETMKISATST
jgi:hypothetical protein